MKLFKKLVAAATCSVMVLGCAPNAFAAQGSDATRVHFNGAYVESAGTILKDGKTYINSEKLLALLSEEAFGEDISSKGFEENGTLYVPLRDAAEGLGCTVGWDDEAKSVILLDSEALFGNAKTDYTLATQYLEYSKSLTEKCPYMTGRLNLAVNTYYGEEKLQITGVCDVKAKTTLDSMAVNTDFALNFGEIEKLIVDSIEQGSTEEEIAADYALLDLIKNFDLDFCMDLKTGKFYIASDLLSSLIGISENTWLLVDFNDIMALAGQSGFDFSTLAKMTQTESFGDYAASLLAFTGADSDVEMAQTYAASLALLKEMFSDASFVKNGNNYTSTYTLSENGAEMTMVMTLKHNGRRIYGVDMAMDMYADGVDMGIDMKMANEDCTVSVTMDMMDMVDVTVDGSFKYLSKADFGVVTPTENSNVLSLTELLGL